MDCPTDYHASGGPQQQPTLTLLVCLLNSVTTALERAAEEKSLLLNKVKLVSKPHQFFLPTDFNKLILCLQETLQVINLICFPDSRHKRTIQTRGGWNYQYVCSTGLCFVIRQYTEKVFVMIMLSIYVCLVTWDDLLTFDIFASKLSLYPILLYKGDVSNWPSIYYLFVYFHIPYFAMLGNDIFNWPLI